MQNTSALYKQLLATEDHYFVAKLDIDGVGTFTEDVLFEISTSTGLFDGSPEIGKAVASEIDVKLLNDGYIEQLSEGYINDLYMSIDSNGYITFGDNASLDNYYIAITSAKMNIPKMACLRPYVKACGFAFLPTTVKISEPNLYTDNATVSGTNITFTENAQATVYGTNLHFPVSDVGTPAESEWIPQGVFYIDTREVTQNDDGLDVLSIHGYDAMLMTEQMFHSENITGDSTDVEMVNDIASAIGVDVDERTYGIMTASYRIPLPVQYTFREILGYIASMYFGSFIITEDGKLRLVSLLELPPETNYLIDEDGYAITFGGDRILV